MKTPFHSIRLAAAFRPAFAMQALLVVALLLTSPQLALSISAVDCTQITETGYVDGTAFDLTVVTVDGQQVEIATANAYYKMAEAAAADGVTLEIISGFRTAALQQFFFDCYTNCDCNNCHEAAPPGYSHHQSGHALDLNTAGWNTAVYNWLAAHAEEFGFFATVPTEHWHWEWWGGGPGGGPCQACVPHCQGSSFIDADCSQLYCASFGLTCTQPSPGEFGCSEPCTPSCEGTVMTSSDCTTGDCGTYGAECSLGEDGEPMCAVSCTPYCEGTQLIDSACEATECKVDGEGWCSYVGGEPTCVEGCNPHCDGDQMVWADCTVGDCGVFGLTCVINKIADGPVCSSPPPCELKCDGSQIITNDCAAADCGVFGQTCDDSGESPVCAPLACTPKCEGTQMTQSNCQIADCGVFGAFCSTAGGTQPHCVSSVCIGSSDEPPEPHETCFFGKRYYCDAAGVAAEIPTPAEICNGVDDDCDGQVDQGLLNACGTCGLAPVETCNGLDDDCDGQVDEDIAVVESCNDKDDDCDGVVDNGFDVGGACTSGLGSCAQSGALVCGPGGTSTVCDAEPGTPQGESCNGIDDDCDGATDEELLNLCGACGEEPPEICSGADDDCDGETDEGYELGEPCDVGIGACAQVGVTVCALDGASTVCDAEPLSPQTEVCNGVDDDCDGAVDEELLNACGECGEVPAESCNEIDDDCDGETDEGFELGQPCLLGEGACEVGGITACAADGAGQICVGEPGEPAEEVCDDGVDNDCDGETDEGCDVSSTDCAPDALKPCTVSDVPKECEAGSQTCQQDGSWGPCVPDVPCEPSPCPSGEEPISELCNELDDDCDGEVDEEGVCEVCLPGEVADCTMEYLSSECQQGVMECGPDGTWGACRSNEACEPPGLVSESSTEQITPLTDPQGDPSVSLDGSAAPAGAGCSATASSGSGGMLWVFLGWMAWLAVARARPGCARGAQRCMASLGQSSAWGRALGR